MESGIGDFFRQIPPGLIIMLCGSGVLLVITFIAIVQARARKARARRASTQAEVSPAAVSAAGPSAELPDLDMLLVSPQPQPQKAVAPQPAAQTRPARKGTYAVALAGGGSADAVEVLAVLRDVVEGGLLVQIGGKVYRSLANDETVKASFLKIMREAANLVKPGDAPPPSTSTAPAEPRPERKGTHTITLADGGTTEAVEVLVILRDVVEGGLLVQIGDKGYHSLADDEAAKANFLKIMREAANIVRPGAASVVPSDTSTSPADSDSEASVSSLRDLLPPVPGESEAAITPKAVTMPPPPAAGGTMPGDLPKYDLDQKIEKKKGGFLGRGKLDLPPVPELNIAGAIETYLQHKLRYTPGYETRSIHVHPAPDGGVSIEVDGRFFETVGDVDDAEVRQFLSSTIQEWQQRH